MTGLLLVGWLVGYLATAAVTFVEILNIESRDRLWYWISHARQMYRFCIKIRRDLWMDGWMATVECDLQSYTRQLSYRLISLSSLLCAALLNHPPQPSSPPLATNLISLLWWRMDRDLSARPSLPLTDYYGGTRDTSSQPAIESPATAVVFPIQFGVWANGWQP